VGTEQVVHLWTSEGNDIQIVARSGTNADGRKYKYSFYIHDLSFLEIELDAQFGRFLKRIGFQTAAGAHLRIPILERGESKEIVSAQVDADLLLEEGVSYLDVFESEERSVLEIE
jgi:hypothetical protein